MTYSSTTSSLILIKMSWRLFVGVILFNSTVRSIDLALTWSGCITETYVNHDAIRGMGVVKVSESSICLDMVIQWRKTMTMDFDTMCEKWRQWKKKEIETSRCTSGMTDGRPQFWFDWLSTTAMVCQIMSNSPV